MRSQQAGFFLSAILRTFLTGSCIAIALAPVAANADWIPNGLLVAQDPAEQVAPALAVTANGNIFVAWQDWRIPQIAPNVYLQSIGSSGTRLWPGQGYAIGTVGLLYRPLVVADGVGGAILVWERQDDRLLWNGWTRRVRNSGRQTVFC